MMYWRPFTRSDDSNRSPIASSYRSLSPDCQLRKAPVRFTPLMLPRICSVLTAWTCIDASALWRAFKIEFSVGVGAAAPATHGRASASAISATLARFVFLVRAEHVVDVRLRFGIRRNTII